MDEPLPADSVPSHISALNDALQNDQLITIYTADCRRTFKIQRQLLIRASSWFDRALDDKFEEGRKGELRFPDTDLVVVEYFVHWLLTRSFLHEQDTTLDQRAIEMSLEIRMWIFADKHFLPDLQNLAMRSLAETLEHAYANIDVLHEGLRDSGPDSLLRTKLVEELACGLEAGEYRLKELRSMSDISDLGVQVAAKLVTGVNNSDLIEAFMVGEHAV